MTMELKVQNFRKEFFLVANKQLFRHRDENVRILVSDMDLRAGVRSDFPPLSEICVYYGCLNKDTEIMRLDLNEGQQSIHFPERDLRFLKRIHDLCLAVTLEFPYDAAELREFPNRPRITNELRMRDFSGTPGAVAGQPDWISHQDIQSIPYLRGEYGLLSVSFAWEQEVYYTKKGTTMESLWEEREKTGDVLLVAIQPTYQGFRCHKSILRAHGFPLDKFVTEFQSTDFNLPFLVLPEATTKAVERLLEHVYERQVDLLRITDVTDLFQAFKVAYTWKLPRMMDEFSALLIHMPLFWWEADEVITLHTFVSEEFIKEGHPTCKRLLERCFHIIDWMETGKEGEFYDCDHFKNRQGQMRLLRTEVNTFMDAQRRNM